MFSLVRRKKISNYNHLQATPSGLGSYGLSFQTQYFNLNKTNDLANNSLITLLNFKCAYLKRTYLILRSYLENRLKTPSKSIKVSCKCLVIFLTKFPNIKNNPLITVWLESDFFIFLLVLLCDNAYIIRTNKRKGLGD